MSPKSEAPGIASRPEPLVLDCTDRVQKALKGFAGRTAKLLSDPAVQTDPHLMGALDDFLGALYALVFARLEGFTARTNRSIEIRVLQQRAQQFAAGTLRTEGNWIAGFHFNSALFRLAAVHHRVLKIVVGRPSKGDRVQDLRSEATRLCRQWGKPNWSRQHLDGIHAQVNTLKHSPKGVFHRRTVRYDDALAGAGELLDLLEVWKSRNP